MNIFVSWVERFQQSGMYQDYLAYLPEGLNNPYFLLLIIIGILIFLVITVKNSIMAIVLNSRNKQRIAELREQQEERETERQREKETLSLVLASIQQGNGNIIAGSKSEASSLATVDVNSSGHSVRKKVVETGEKLEAVPTIPDTAQPEKKPVDQSITRKKNMSLLGLDEQSEYTEKELYKLSEAKQLKGDVSDADEELVREKIDYEPILNEKKNEDRPPEKADGLVDILTEIQHKKQNEQSMKEFEEKNAATKQRNMAILDKQVKSNFRVEKKD